jgi:cysteine desulfurase
MSASIEQPVYLDYAATAPLDPRVRAAMVASMDEFGNPASATHAYGSRAQQLVDNAAQQTAALINAQPDELIWTSGATESDNLAIIGAARYRAMLGRHIVTSAIEHKAVLESCGWLATQGFAVTYLQPEPDGTILPAAVAAAIRPDTTLVSIMHANNETGAINDIAAIGAICRAADTIFHVDAAQSVGKLPVDVEAQAVDLLSFNAHKACGPKGIGALYMGRRMRRIEPLMFGGGQQRGIRPGTLAVHQIAGMGAAMAILATEMEAEVSRVTALRDDLREAILTVPGVIENTPNNNGLCSILNVSVADVEGESLRFALDELAVSSGSACNSASGEPSYVLRALGRSDQLAEASIRFSLGRYSTAEDVAQAAELFARAVAYLQGLAPLSSAAGR